MEEQSRYNFLVSGGIKAGRQYEFPRVLSACVSPRRGMTGGRTPFQKFVFGPGFSRRSFSFTWKMPDVSHVADVTCNAVVPPLSRQMPYSYTQAGPRIQIVRRGLEAVEPREPRGTIYACTYVPTFVSMCVCRNALLPLRSCYRSSIDSTPLRSIHLSSLLSFCVSFRSTLRRSTQLSRVESIGVSEFSVLSSGMAKTRPVSSSRSRRSRVQRQEFRNRALQHEGSPI